MTTALQTTSPNKPASKPSALNLMASRLSVDPAKLLATLKSTVFQKATDEELLALVVVANEYGLNPFLKELYAFPAKGGGIVPIVSVDGWNKMLIRQENFDGIEFEFHETDGELFACTATIYVKNRTKPVKITEYLNECKHNTDPWNNMPRRMLRNRTLCQASRLAFGFSGIYNDDEAATVIDVTATVVQPTEPPPKLVAPPSASEDTPQKQLEAIVLSAGFTFSDLQKFGEDSGNIPDASSMGSFSEVPVEIAKRLVRAKIGLLKSLEQLKGGK